MVYPRLTAVVGLITLSAVPALSQRAVEVGMGVNSATGALRNTCVSISESAEKPPEPFPGFAGKSFEYQYKVVENIEELRESLEVSASSSVHGLWGSASAAANYLKSVQVSQYDLTMVVQARILGEPTATRVSRDDSALMAGSQKLTPSQILLKCGDEFVSALRYGGTIHGLLVVNTRSRAERERLGLALSGSFRSGVEVDAQAQHSIEKLLRNNSYHINFFQEGGEKSVAFPETGIAAFFTWAHLTEREILAHPAVMKIETKPLSSVYSELDLVGAAGQRDTLRRLESLSASAQDRQRNLAFIARHQFRFPGAKINDVAHALEDVGDLLKEVAYLADDCYRTESLCSKDRLSELSKQWKVLNTELPNEEPLYGVFDLSSFDSSFRVFSRDAGCPERWEWTVIPNDLEITTKNSKLTYYFTCERKGYCYKCGRGNWDCSSGDGSPKWTGKVTADLAVTGDVVSVSNVYSPGNRYDGACESPLMDFIKQRDGARVR